MSQSGVLHINNGPSGSLAFDTDSGTAISSSGIIHIVGAAGTTTSASGSTVTIHSALSFYISGSIDFTVAGINNFVTLENRKFIVSDFGVVSDTITGFNNGPNVSWGWTAPLYQDWTGTTFANAQSGQQSSFNADISGTDQFYPPAGSILKVSVDTPADAASFIGRFYLSGYYFT